MYSKYKVVKTQFYGILFHLHATKSLHICLLFSCDLTANKALK